MRLKPPLENSIHGCIASLLKEIAFTLDDEDMANCQHESNLWKNLNSDPTICDLYEKSLFLKETFVNEELPETASTSEKNISQPSICNTPDSELVDVLDVSLEVSNVEDIYFEDDYLQDYNYLTNNQSIQSPQFSLTCSIECINHSKYTTDHLVLDEFDRCEDSYIHCCDPWPVGFPLLSLKLRQESINSIQVIPEKNSNTKGVSNELCTTKQSSRRKHHSAPDILCHDNYSISSCHETPTHYNIVFEKILSNSLEGLQIAFDCSLMDSSICSEDIDNSASPLQNVEKCTNGLCRSELPKNVQPTSVILSLSHTNSDFNLLSGEFSVVHQHKYKRKLSSSPASTFISHFGFDEINCISTDLVDNEIQTSFHKKDRGPNSAVRIFHCTSTKLERQCDVYGKSNVKIIENISPIFPNQLPTPYRFLCKKSVLVSISSDELFHNLALHFESPSPECKFVTANRMTGLQQSLCIFFVHLIAAIIVPMNSGFYFPTLVERKFLLTVTVVLFEYTSTKGHFIIQTKKNILEKITTTLVINAISKVPRKR